MCLADNLYIYLPVPMRSAVGADLGVFEIKHWVKNIPHFFKKNSNS